HLSARPASLTACDPLSLHDALPIFRTTGLLIQLPGIGMLTAMRIFSAIGEMTRVPSAKHLCRNHRSRQRVGDSGLGAGMYANGTDRKSTRLNSSHDQISYAVFCLKK